MIQTTCALIATLATCPAFEPALASRYDMGPTVHTLQARLDMGHITPDQVAIADGFVAVGDCSRIGEWLYVRAQGANEWLKMLVYDCAGVDAVQFMQHISIEVDYWTAQAWGFDCLCAWPVEVVTP